MIFLWLCDCNFHTLVRQELFPTWNNVLMHEYFPLKMLRTQSHGCLHGIPVAPQKDWVEKVWRRAIRHSAPRAGWAWKRLSWCRRHTSKQCSSFPPAWARPNGQDSGPRTHLCLGSGFPQCLLGTDELLECFWSTGQMWPFEWASLVWVEATTRPVQTTCVILPNSFPFHGRG